MGAKSTIFENNFLRVESEPAGDREIITFDRVKTQTGAIVVPVLRDGRIVLTREFRHGAGKDVIGVVKGAADHPSETATDVAGRELKEELGISAAYLVETTQEVYALPSLTATRGRVVFAYECEFTSDQDLEPDEDVGVYRKVSLHELAKMLRAGEINDAESCVALQAFLLNRLQED